MLAHLKIICQFHAHSVHQNSVMIAWAEIYRRRFFLRADIYQGRLFLGLNQVSFNRTLVISPPPYCTRVSKDTGSNPCERKIFRPSVYILFLDISNISARFAGI
jgi:hypothetical protein